MDEADDHLVFKTKFGYAKLVLQNLSSKKQQNIERVYYLDNNASANFMKKILKTDKQALIIMDPSTNYTNLMQLNQKVQKMIEE